MTTFGLNDLNNLLEVSQNEDLRGGIDSCKVACASVLGEVLRAVHCCNNDASKVKVTDPEDSNSIIEQLRKLPPSSSNLNVDDICTKVQGLLDTIQSLEERWSQMDSKIDGLRTGANDTEQYLKNYNLLFKGLIIPYHLKGLEFTEDIVRQINCALPYLKGN